MQYPDSGLLKDEEVVFDVHHHACVFVKPALLLLIYLASWIALLAKVGPFRNGWALIAGLAGLLLVLGYFAWRIVVWTHVNLVLTNQRLIYEFGVFSRHGQEIPLSKINDVSSSQMVLGRIFGCGDLVIKSASESGLSAFFDLPNPEKLKLEITERTHALNVRGGDHKALAQEVARAVTSERPTAELPPLPPERPPFYSEIVDQIERLEALREKGALSDDEFQEAKEGLIERLKGEPDS